MPVEMAASRASFEAYFISVTSVVTPFFLGEGRAVDGWAACIHRTAHRAGIIVLDLDHVGWRFDFAELAEEAELCPLSSMRQRQRYLPPGRTSILSGIDQPG